MRSIRNSCGVTSLLKNATAERIYHPLATLMIRTSISNFAKFSSNAGEADGAQSGAAATSTCHLGGLYCVARFATFSGIAKQSKFPSSVGIHQIDILSKFGLPQQSYSTPISPASRTRAAPYKRFRADRRSPADPGLARSGQSRAGKAITY